jgi:predicted enzyme related to lactoylglutathione lyase
VEQGPGALCWTELTTGDTKTAEKFYSQLFGWTAKHSNIPGMEYTEFHVDGTADAGMMPTPKEMPNVPPNWLPYFEVTDTDASASKAVGAGGTQIVPPTDIPNVGRFAIIQDPQGAVFALFKGAQAR